MGEQKKNEKPERSFEEALARLEKIVKDMESGDLPLDKTMKLFEEGMKLSKFCTARLGETEKKIEVLMKESAEGDQWAPLAEDPPAAQEFDFE